MFDDTIVNILGNNPNNSKIKSVFADVQEYNLEMEIENIRLNVYKRLYIDYVEPLVRVTTYLEIENEIVQVVKVNKFSNYLEVFVCKVENIKINNIDKAVIIVDIHEKVIDYKTIITDFGINTGDTIEYQGTNWLIIGEVSKTNTIYKASMRKVHHTLKFYVKGEKIFETPTIAEVSTQSIQDGKVISTIDGKIELFIRDITAHRKITYNNRLILMGIAWEIEGHTRETQGLIHLYCKKVQFVTDDDKALEIAFNETYNTDIPEEIPPVALTPYSIIAAGETLSIDTINLEAQRTFKVIDSNTNLEHTGAFTFTLEKAIDINDIETNVLIALIDNITGASCRLTANTKVKGYFYLVATCEDIVIKKLLRTKGILDK